LIFFITENDEITVEEDDETNVEVEVSEDNLNRIFVVEI